MRTKDRLAKVLNDIGAPAVMVELALRGEYDDFESSSATPICDLIQDCRKANLHDIASRAMNGEFDGSKEEAEAWFAREGGLL